MSFYKDVGWLIIGTRLKRLSDRFVNEVTKVYKHFNIKFEPSWFPIFYLLHKNKSLTLSQITELLEVTHSAVSQMITNLKTRGIVEILSDDADERKKHILLTASAQKRLPRLLEIWEVLDNTMYDLLPTVADRQNFLQYIGTLEHELNRNSLSDKAIEQILKINRRIKFSSYTSNFDNTLTEFLFRENLNNSINRNNLRLAFNGKELIGFIEYRITEQNITIDNFYLGKLNTSAKVGVSMLTDMSDNFLIDNDKYFIVRKPGEQMLRYLLKSGFPFMVKQ